MSLQEGIYYAPGARPGAAFAIIFLRAEPTADAEKIGTAIQALWDTYRGLKSGNSRDLPGHPFPSGNLTTLIGFGIKAFRIAKAKRAAPEALASYGAFRSPLASGGGPLLSGSGLSYSDDTKVNPATEEVVVQFIADTQLAVRRAVVETWKTLYGAGHSIPTLAISSYFAGFQRDDGRSWIDFHDGVSNLKSTERYSVIAIKATGDPSTAWTQDGSYLTFIRSQVDLPMWQRLSADAQSILVGRAKLTGCPLQSVTQGGIPVPVDACPAAGKSEVGGDDVFRETPANPDARVGLSHVQRANHHREPVEDPGSVRVYRQGYEFLEAHDRSPGFRAGLNFVSFQDTPERIYRLLTHPGWLGSTNFGGIEGPSPESPILLSVLAAGLYFVPPGRDNDRFPGQDIFFA
jgi:Dyp-type peroxidase family